MTSTDTQEHSISNEMQSTEVVAFVEAAQTAGLRYVTDTSPGIRRRRAGRHFSYIGLNGKPIHDHDELKRIRTLAIPPAWTNIWICPNPQGHIQATGRDAKGRKQYRYHPRWREIRDETKYGRMLTFGKALPLIRERVEHDLRLSGLPREKVLATVVRLLDITAIRIGNEEYARENNSFGLTTMRGEHVDVKGSHVHFRFCGKRGKEHRINIQDRQLARIIKKCQDLPGHELFEYYDEHGILRVVQSDDVNDYLHMITEQHFTAKDFRTWAGTVMATCALLELGEYETQTQAKKNLVCAIEEVSKHLGNTPAICRKSYVHPEIINSYLNGSLFKAARQPNEQAVEEALHGLHAEEISVMTFLQQA